MATILGHCGNNGLAQFASKLAQQKIVIGQIQVGWQGVNPHFVVSDIDLYDAQNRPALQLKNTDLSLFETCKPME